MSRRRNGASEACFEEAPDTERTCAHPGCPDDGLYPAPQSPRHLDQRQWFCLEHVRAYNRAWNFHAGMAPDEIERCIRQDTVWHRPTWPLGNGGHWSGSMRWRDRLGVFSDPPEGESASDRSAEPAPAEQQALAMLDLAPPVSLEEIKARYKSLAKRLHPDANGGDQAAEEKLKLINQAYTFLKNCGIP